jgi:hypothetical protein
LELQTHRQRTGILQEISHTSTVKIVAIITTASCSNAQITAQVTDGSNWDHSWSSAITLLIGGDCKHPDSSA